MAQPAKVHRPEHVRSARVAPHLFRHRERVALSVRKANLRKACEFGLEDLVSMHWIKIKNRIDYAFDRVHGLASLTLR